MTMTWQTLAEYPYMGDTVRDPSACPNCGESDFTWNVFVFANDSAPGHNLMGLHDVHVTALRSCDNCSEDVGKLDANEIGACLDYLTRIGEGP